MKENRCPTCNHLLFKSTVIVEAEVLCPKCRRIHYSGDAKPEERLRGKDFQSKSLEILCKDCGRLSLRVVGGKGILEVKCPYCKKLHTYNAKELAEHTHKYSTFDRARWGK